MVTRCRRGMSKEPEDEFAEAVGISGKLQWARKNKLAACWIVVGSVPYGVVLAFLGFFAALLGSLHAEAIKSATPVCCVVRSFQGEAMVYAEAPVWIFWGFASTWVALFAFRQAADSRALRRTRQHGKELKNAVEQTIGTTNTIATDLGGAQKSINEIVEATGKLSTALDAATKLITNETKPIKDSLSEAAGKAGELSGIVGDVKAQVNSIEKTTEALAKSLKDAGRVVNAVLTQVQTMPPQGYLDALASYTLSAQDLKLKQLPSTEYAREIMACIIKLAKIYDGRRGVRYAANIMRFERTGSESFDMTLAMTDPPLPHGHDWNDAGGILWLDESLTASVDDPDGRDRQVTPICFAIPLDLEKGKALLFPGAAEAFAREQGQRRSNVVAYSTADLQDFPKRMRACGEFDEATVKRMEDLFGSDGVQSRWIRSGISIPLYSKATGKWEGVGVLNIHCDKKSPLRKKVDDQEGRDGFTSTIQHFVLSLSETLWPLGDSTRPGDAPDN